jgi:predicted  nucleic acid-binding Zn-ribbon protein
MVFVMTLAKDDLPELKTFSYEWLAEAEAGRRPSAFELSLQERLIRVEEALSNQIELTRQGFAAMEKRFESIDKRFELMEKRFDSIDKRFEAADKRFEATDKRFEATDKRFEAVDKRFDAVDKRFDAVDKRFDAITLRMDRFMLWSFSTTIAGSGLVIAVLKLWPPV